MLGFDVGELATVVGRCGWDKISMFMDPYSVNEGTGIEPDSSHGKNYYFNYSQNYIFSSASVYELNISKVCHQHLPHPCKTAVHFLSAIRFESNYLAYALK